MHKFSDFLVIFVKHEQILNDDYFLWKRFNIYMTQYVQFL